MKVKLACQRETYVIRTVYKRFLNLKTQICSQITILLYPVLICRQVRRRYASINRFFGLVELLNFQIQSRRIDFAVPYKVFLASWSAGHSVSHCLHCNTLGLLQQRPMSECNERKIVRFLPSRYIYKNTNKNTNLFQSI